MYAPRRVLAWRSSSPPAAAPPPDHRQPPAPPGKPWQVFSTWAWYWVIRYLSVSNVDNGPSISFTDLQLKKGFRMDNRTDVGMHCSHRSIYFISTCTNSKIQFKWNIGDETVEDWWSCHWEEECFNWSCQLQWPDFAPSSATSTRHLSLVTKNATRWSQKGNVTQPWRRS